MFWVQNKLQKCFFAIAFFQKQTVAVIQGVVAVIAASIPAVDENVNYEALVECVFILNGEYSSVQNAEFYRDCLFDLTEIQLARETGFTGEKLVLVWFHIYKTKLRDCLSKNQLHNLEVGMGIVFFLPAVHPVEGNFDYPVTYITFKGNLIFHCYWSKSLGQTLELSKGCSEHKLWWVCKMWQELADTVR